METIVLTAQQQLDIIGYLSQRFGTTIVDWSMYLEAVRAITGA